MEKSDICFFPAEKKKPKCVFIRYLYIRDPMHEYIYSLISTSSTIIMSTEQRNSERSTLVAQLRIQRDLKSIEESHDSTIVFASQSDGDSLHIEAGITGPLSTSYENGTFLVNLKLPETYPVSWKKIPTNS